MDVSWALEVQRQVPEITGRQGDQQAGIERQQECGAAQVACHPGVRGMRAGDAEVGFLEDRVPVEMRRRGLADHLVELRQSADGAGMADRQVVALHEVLGEDLPVGVPDETLVEPFGVVGEIEGADQVFDIGEMFGHRYGAGVQ